MPKILDWKQLRVATDLKYAEPRAGGTHDGFSVSVTALDRSSDPPEYRPLIFCGPRMAIPFGLKRKDAQYGARYSADMTFPGVTKSATNGTYEGPPELVAFLKFVMDLDENNKKVAHSMCKSWFNKQLDATVLSEFYFSNVMLPREEQKYSPTLSTRIQHNGTSFKTQFFNQNRQTIEFDSIGAGLNVIPLIETRGIWLAGKSFGMSLKLVQLMIFERDEFVGCCIDSGLPEAPRAPVHPPAPVAHPALGGALAPGMVLPDEDASDGAEDGPAYRPQQPRQRSATVR
jgi:hypothetical protein